MKKSHPFSLFNFRTVAKSQNPDGEINYQHLEVLTDEKCNVIIPAKTIDEYFAKSPIPTPNYQDFCQVILRAYVERTASNIEEDIIDYKEIEQGYIDINDHNLYLLLNEMNGNQFWELEFYGKRFKSTTLNQAYEQLKALRIIRDNLRQQP